MECRDIDSGIAQSPSKIANQTGLVRVGDIKHVRTKFRLDRDILDLDNARLVAAEQSTGHGPRPTSARVSAFLGRAIKKAGSKPKYIITDQGREFCGPFKSWCGSRGIRPRVGAVGKHGSICVVERFIRSMKTECTRRILVSFRLDQMRRELAFYASWYNEHRPHMGLEGRTPEEVSHGLPAAADAPRFETRARWPRGIGKRKGRAGGRLTLDLRYVGNRRHLPVVELKRAA